MKRLSRTVAGVLAFLAAAGVSHAGNDVWKVGVARVAITPVSSTWLGGYAARTGPSVGVRTELWAKALALEDARGNKGLILTMDLLSIPKDFSDQIRSEVYKKYGIDKSGIILNVSHTHSGPVVGDALFHIYPMDKADRKIVHDYTRTLSMNLLKVIDEAFGDMKPARISTGNGLARFTVNRRNNPAASLTSVTALKGPSDHAVPVMKVEGTDGKVFAILFGYACHATTLSDNYFSGDYPGYAQMEVERLYPDATALFFQGCGADQNPIPRGRVSQAVQYGKQLAASVEEVLSNEMDIQESNLKTCYEEIPLTFDEPKSKEELEQLAQGNDYFARWAGGMLEQQRKGPYAKTYPYPIECWKIGGQKIFALGGEVVTGYAVSLKERYGMDTFVMGYSNDIMSYIPTEVVWKEGGYESVSAAMVYNLPARWTSDVEATILEAIDAMLKKNVF